MRVPQKAFVPFLSFLSICVGTSHGAVVAKPASPVLIAQNAQPFYTTLGIAANNSGYLRNFANGGSFFTWIDGSTGNTFYQNSSVPQLGPDIPFPSLAQGEVHFNNQNLAPVNGAVFGEENWIAFSNGIESGWISFDLGQDGFISQVNYFVYDDDNPLGGLPLSKAIEYSTGVDPMASAVPEFSSGMALGALFLIGGCSYRRRAAKR